MWQPNDLAISVNPAKRFDRADAISGPCDQTVYSREDVEKGMGEAVTPDDDATTVIYAKFLKSLKKALGSEKAERRVCNQFPQQYRAYLLFMSNSPVKWAMEAFIVADVDATAIGGALSLDPATVEEYERVFFDVRIACRNPSFVSLCLVKEAANGRLDKVTTEGLWKLSARFQGPQVVADMITTYRLSPEGASSMADGARAELLKKLYRNIGSVRITDDNVAALLEATGLSEKDTPRGMGELPCDRNQLEQIKMSVKSVSRKALPAKVIQSESVGATNGQS